MQGELTKDFTFSASFGESLILHVTVQTSRTMAAYLRASYWMMIWARLFWSYLDTIALTQERSHFRERLLFSLGLHDGHDVVIMGTGRAN